MAIIEAENWRSGNLICGALRVDLDAPPNNRALM